MTGNEDLRKIDEFLDNSLSKTEKADFIQKVETDETFKSEIKLQKEIREAIIEDDIIDLRKNLTAITQEKDSSVFDLSEKYSTLNNPDHLASEIDEIEIENTLQKIHLKNHKTALTEQLTDMLQPDTNAVNLQQLEAEERLLWSEIENAFMEEDITVLRNDIGNIIFENQPKTYNDFEVDSYLSHDAPKELKLEIDNALATNNKLADQINLHYEIDDAIKEADVMALRDSIQNIYFEQEVANMDMIDNYLLGTISQDEESTVEEMKINNTRFAETLQLNKEINSAITEDDIIHLRSEISAIIEEDKDEKTNIQNLIPVQFSKRLKWISIAASILIIFSVGLTYLNNERISIEQAYVKYYNGYETHLTYRSSITEYNNTINNGIRAYAQSEYQKSIQLLSKAHEPKGKFYLGLSYMGLNEFDKASKALNEVIQHKNNLFTEQAEWYSALCLVAQNNKAKAIKTLNKIAYSESYYSSKAKNLLKDIR